MVAPVTPPRPDLAALARALRWRPHPPDRPAMLGRTGGLRVDPDPVPMRERLIGVPTRP